MFLADCQVRFEVLPSRVQSTLGVFDPVSGSDASNRLNRYSRVIDGTGEFAGSKFDAWKGYGKFARGRIALQDHGDQVSFRNLRIKVLD